MGNDGGVTLSVYVRAEVCVTIKTALCGKHSKTLDKKATIHYNDTANGEVPKWLKGLPC